jgi:hypothetical protein
MAGVLKDNEDFVPKWIGEQNLLATRVTRR